MIRGLLIIRIPVALSLGSVSISRPTGLSQTVHIRYIRRKWRSGVSSGGLTALDKPDQDHGLGCSWEHKSWTSTIHGTSRVHELTITLHEASLITACVRGGVKAYSLNPEITLCGVASENQGKTFNNQ